MYAMGWFVDTYNGHSRIAHGGYLHDINSEVMIFSADRIGIVSFTNFGFPALARMINQHVFDLIMGLETVPSARNKLDEYGSENQGQSQTPRFSVPRKGHRPAHPAGDYAGRYDHPGYGRFEITHDGGLLTLKRNNLVLPLEHWHYDAWVAQDVGIFYLHARHAFDTSSRILFETSADGAIVAFSIPLEPAVAPIRFVKQ